MTAVRRLLILACVVSALAMSAQTRKTSKAAPRPAPVTVTMDPSQSEPADLSSGRRPVTTNVQADTDKDGRNARALRLSLDDAIRTAAEKNLGVQIQRYDYQMAGQNLRGSYGAFDFFATADVEHQSQKSPTISRFASNGGRNTFANFGVQQFLPTGGTYNLGFRNSRDVTTGGGTFINPAYRSSLSASLDQPLLRNFGTDISRRGINIARNTLGISREAFRQRLMNTAVSVEQAYLDLIYARQYVDVVKESLFLARDQARITQIRIDVGASAPLDILQPNVQTATVEGNLIVAVASVRDAEDRLRQLMHLDPSEWDRPIIPTDPIRYVAAPVDAEAGVARAMELRPELREAGLTTATRKIQYLYARNQVLPKLDAVLSYNAAGLAGRTLDIDPVTGLPTGTSTTTNYTSALNQAFGNDSPSWSVGFTVGVPILNIGARAEKKRAELDLAQSKTEELLTRENVAVEVRKAARDIDTSAKEITATRTAREAAEKNLDAERKRYENGMTTNFQVLQVQEQLSTARVREIQSLVGYNKSLANYHRAVGDLLEARNIRVDEETADEPQLFNRFNRYPWLTYEHRLEREGAK